MTKSYEVRSVTKPRYGRYDTWEVARAAVARLSAKNPTEDFRIFEIVETETLLYTTEKNVEVTK